MGDQPNNIEHAYNKAQRGQIQIGQIEYKMLKGLHRPQFQRYVRKYKRFKDLIMPLCVNKQ